MRALDRKMLRDLWGMRGQALAIALVVVSGVATYVAMTSVMNTLQSTLDAYYEDYRFADGFASVRRAPEHVLERLRTIPGVNEVQARITAGVNLEVPGFEEPVAGLLVSVPEGSQPVLNRLFVREGRLVERGRENEVVLNEVFAEAHGLRPGSEFTAIVNGRRRTLSVVGIALSPEFLMQIQPGSIFPDPERFGVMWMGREALAAAQDMEGAFNDVAFTLAPGARSAEVLERVDALLDRYGSQGAYPRADQPSHLTLTEEFRQLAGMAFLLPLIFLAVAAFLLNMVVTRMVTLQREQIAVLKAFGYSNGAIGFHYVKLVLAIAVLGCVVGTAAGAWMGGLLGEIYLEYYRFPSLDYTLRLPVVLTAAALTVGASLIGVVQAVRRAVGLPPAEAMRPAPPARYRPTLVERLGMQRFLDQPTRMILRNLEREPLKAGMTVFGMAISCAILIMGLFFVDAFDRMIEIQYGIAQRDDLTVVFAEPTSAAALHELQGLPGVLHAEPFRSVPVRLRRGHRSYATAIEGIPPGAYLRRVINTDLKPIAVPPDGLLLTERLAVILHARPGDALTVEVIEGRRLTRTATVAGITQQFIGVAAYMDLAAANRLAGGGNAISGAFLLTDPAFDTALTDALHGRPRVASTLSQDLAIRTFRETAAETMLVFTFVLSLFAGVIAFGVVYNSARISLSERDRELASLRVLGFTRGEIAYVLLGELAVLTLLAIPLGLALGAVASAGVVEAVQTDLYQIPLVLTRGTFTLAAVIVLAAALLSGLIVRRKLHRLDLIGVLKARE